MIQHSTLNVYQPARNFTGQRAATLPCQDQSRNNFPISVALFDPKPQAMVF